MIFFLFVPVESAAPEMAALTATGLDEAIKEAEALPFAGRTGYLFEGDRFVQEIRTADTLREVPAFADPYRSPPAAALRPG
ncbi:hypothetical protein [Brevundimonas sp. GCM10030266]|uniref:hypothetical protein n=1 Tax=Brevundimonas sp. GCM10030266 TaxID=3273386 RepID=UPI00360F555E